MDDIIKLTEIDYTSWLVTGFFIMTGILAIVLVVTKFWGVLSTPLNWVKQRNEDHQIVASMVKSLDELSKRHDNDVKHSIEHDKRIEETLNKFMKEIRDVTIENSNNIKQFSENRIHDRQQSFEIQKELTDSQKETSKALNEVIIKIDKMKQDTDERFSRNEQRQRENEQRENERVQAELKDKISDSYRRYHEKQQINEMEFEALKGLIKTYEAYGGENSFVHSKVEPEMYTWEQIE